MTNDKAQMPNQAQNPNDQTVLNLKFGICLGFGFWNLEFSQGDCHALPTCHCEADEVSRSNLGGTGGLP